MTASAPRLLHRISHLVRSVLRSGRVERELDEELRFHFDALVERRVAEGLSAEEARREAEREFGSLARARAECREAWPRRLLDELRRDVVFAVRSLRRAPSFSVVAILVLALGIGATTTIFGVFDAVLLRPLPYPESDRLMTLAYRYDSGNLRTGHDRAGFETVRDLSTLLEDVAASTGSSGVNLQWSGGARYVRAISVTASYLDALGARVELGRAFVPADEDPGAPRRVIASRTVFERDLGGDSGLLGSIVRLGGEPHELVGVMSGSFDHTSPVDLWKALSSDDHRGGGYNLQVLARLRPGVTMAQAASELAALTPSYHERISAAPGSNEHLMAVSLQEDVTGDLREDLLLLFAAVGLLLLIACVNTAALLLARSSAREREMAVRQSLGGGRLRLLRQLLNESLVLGLAGGALGIAIAALGLRWTPLLSVIAPGGAVDVTVWEPRLDLRVLAVALVVSLLSALAFGVAPALRSLSLQAGGGRHSSSASAILLHRALVVLEVGLCVLLLVGAGLLLQSLRSLRAVDSGIDPEGVVTAQMSLAGDPEPEERLQRYVALLEELAASPAIESAALTNGLPVERGLNLPIFVPGQEDSGDLTSVDWRYVTPGFFETLGIPVIRGRAFTAADGEEGAVVAVNEAFVRRYFEGAEPLGRVLEIYREGPEGVDRPREIVGVVGDVKGNGLTGSAIPTLYVPLAQVPRDLLSVTHAYYPMSWVVRSGPGGNAAGLLTGRVRALDPEVPFAAVREMTEVIADTYGDRRVQATLLGSFAVLALAMAITGIYGLIAYTVSRRTREIGIRTALGAAWGRTVSGVVRQAALLAAAGVAVGLVASLLLRRLIEGFLFGVESSDPRTLAAAAVAVLGAAALAGLAPALRAARIDPVIVLRQE
ncbi:MAG TPA: ADOP family duplicated permease [Thermoanaerobaculia bacterium]|nr:ADOP family duplicated permease [Thermoanaerobaculia bacterium]